MISIITQNKPNLLQRAIRTRILEHLTLQPTVDVVACLLLMSVVKDAESLSDYAKNLYEITKLIDRRVFARYFSGLDKGIPDLFEQTKGVFIDADKDKAKAASGHEKRIAKSCDKIVEILPLSELDYFDERKANE